MNLCHRVLNRSGGRGFTLLLMVALAFRSGAAISEGPPPQNAVEEQQQRKLLFDQAILSNQEKLRVGRERYDRQQLERAKIIQGMAAELQARQQAVALQPAPPPLVGLRARLSGWSKPALEAALAAIALLSLGGLFRQRRAAAFRPDRRG